MMRTRHMRIHPAYRARLQACELDTVERVLGRVDGQVAAWSRTTDTLYVACPDGGPGFYVKRHYFPNWTKRLRGTFRGTFFGAHRGEAEYQALCTLRGVGVPAVRAVAYGSERSAHFLTTCFLITEEVPGAENLTTLAQSAMDGDQPLDRRQRRETISTLARELATMHGLGVSHGNLFWRNLLFRSGPDGTPELFLLDVHPLTRWQRLRAGQRWWLRELAQTAVSALPFTSRTERMRFFKSYLQVRRVPKELRNDVREIERIAAGWQSHENRRIHMNRLFRNWAQQLGAERANKSAAGAVP